MNELENKVKYLTNKDLKKFRNTDLSKLVIWCGAGIGKLEPSNLPLGKELVDFVLEQMLGKEFIEELYKKLECIDEVLMYRGISMGKSLRLESVISEINQIEYSLKPGNNKHLSFSKSIGEIVDAPYNVNHKIIAWLITCGSMVVTTNYDICIEKAIRDIDNKEEFSFSRNDDGIYEYGSNNEKYGRVYHIHGTVEEPENIGITYQTVSRNFSDKFEKMLDTWLEEDYTFLFLGYSCSDNYDVERYFERLYARNIAVNANAIFVQHDQEDKPKELCKSIEKYLSFFRDVYAITTDTERFLKQLASNFHFNTWGIGKGVNEFQWKEKLKNKIVISEEIKGLLFLRICRLIGINPECFQFYFKSMEAFNKMFALKKYPVESILVESTWRNSKKEEWDIEDCKSIINQSLTESEIYSFYKNEWERNKNDIYEMEGNYKKLIENLPVLENIYNRLYIQRSENKRIGWESSSPLHKHTKVLWNVMKREVKKKKSFYLSRENRAKAKEQLKCINSILELDFEKLLEVNQYCVALRSKAMLMIFLYGEKEYSNIMNDVFKALDIYICETSIEGVVSCLYLSTTLSFLAYLQTQRYYYLLSAKEALSDVKKLAVICKSKRFQKYADDEEKWQKGCLYS